VLRSWWSADIQQSTNTRIEHVCKRWSGNLLVLTRGFFVANEIYMGFLLNSQAQGVFAKHEQSTQTPWRGDPEVRGLLQLHQLHRLKADPGNIFMFLLKK